MPFSYGDIIGLAKLSWDIYGFCQAAPAELEGLSIRLESISRKLERLSAVLRRSGLGTWTAIPRLEQHLLDARVCLDPLRVGHVGKASVPLKAKGLVRLAFSQDKLRQVEMNLDADERAIDEMRMDIVIESSLRNMQQMHDLQSHLMGNQPHAEPKEPVNYLLDDTLRESAPAYMRTDPMDAVQEKSSMVSRTISNASSALKVAARLTHRASQIEHVDSPSAIVPDNRSDNTSMTTNFLKEVVSIAEETELYARDTQPEYKLKQLSKLNKRITGIWPTSLPFDEAPAYAAVLSEHEPQRAPDMLEAKPERYSDLPIPLPEHPVSGSQLKRDPLSWTLAQGQFADDLSLKEIITPSMEHTTNLSNQKLVNPLSLIGRASVSLGNRVTPPTYCTFDMEVSNDLAILRITFADKQRAFSDGCIPTLGTLPVSSLPFYRSQSMSYPPSSLHTRIVQHCFPVQQRPIPHLLHPNIEGPEEEPDAPYTVTFTDQQNIYEEGVREGQRRWTTSLKYIFHEKQDQITFCTNLFGKRLIATAGTNKITYNGRDVSLMCAATLWSDDRSKAHSVTFYPSLTGKKAVPKDVEINVLGLCEKKKQPRNANAIAIMTDVMPGKAGSPHWVKACSKCVIEFTRYDDQVLFSKYLE